MSHRRAASSSFASLPVAVIGAGPVGLAAAAYLLDRGETPLVLEAGDAVGSSVREWGHVRLFSPWKYLVDAAARRRLEASGWVMPDGEILPTGRQLVEQYLEPLAALPAVARTLRLRHRVIAVTRLGFDKVKSAGREQAPFELVVDTGDGGEQRLLARAVIDASGTWASPNPLGSSGLPLAGERRLGGRFSYRIPDVLGRDRDRHAGKRTLVVGSGHSAFNALLDLLALAEQAPGTGLTWALRRDEVGLLFGGGTRDALSARGSLGERLRERVAAGAVEMVLGFRARHVDEAPGGGVSVHGEDGRVLGPFDEVVVTTGFRPDLALTRELRLSLDAWLESPVQLAPLIDPNVHSCGTVYPHGANELAHPEKDFYVVGMKSYGRAPTFLLLTGYEQVRSVVAQLAGDAKAAGEVQLALPETGVCVTDLVAGKSACCGAGASCAVQ
jgi:thioredoxin reductase